MLSDTWLVSFLFVPPSNSTTFERHFATEEPDLVVTKHALFELAETYLFFQNRVNHFRPSRFILNPLSLTSIFSCYILIHSLLRATPIIPFSSSHTSILPRLALLLPFALPFSFRSLIVFFFFNLETIQIPSIMLELQKPGQSAATSEAPGIAARYVSANTTTTRPLHESNS